MMVTEGGGSGGLRKICGWWMIKLSECWSADKRNEPREKEKKVAFRSESMLKNAEKLKMTGELHNGLGSIKSHGFGFVICQRREKF